MLQLVSLTDTIVVKEVIDAKKVVINKGFNQGIKIGDRFLIYNIGEEIIDPATNKPHGHLEVTKGTGTAINVQENEAIVESDRKMWTTLLEKAKDNPALLSMFVAAGACLLPLAGPMMAAVLLIPEYKESVMNNLLTSLPFNTPKVGDRAKHIK